MLFTIIFWLSLIVTIILRWKHNQKNRQSIYVKIVDSIIIFPFILITAFIIYGAAAFGFYSSAPTHNELTSQQFVQELNEEETVVEKYVIKNYKVKFDSEVLNYFFTNKYFVLNISNNSTTERFEVE